MQNETPLWPPIRKAFLVRSSANKFAFAAYLPQHNIRWSIRQSHRPQSSQVEAISKDSYHQWCHPPTAVSVHWLELGRMRKTRWKHSGVRKVCAYSLIFSCQSTLFFQTKAKKGQKYLFWDPIITVKLEPTNGHEWFGGGAWLGDTNPINSKHPHLIQHAFNHLLGLVCCGFINVKV